MCKLHQRSYEMFDLFGFRSGARLQYWFSGKRILEGWQEGTNQEDGVDKGWQMFVV
jgi:hypothetical protein